MPNCHNCRSLVGVGQLRCHRCGTTVLQTRAPGLTGGTRTDPMAIGSLVLSLLPCAGLFGLVLGILSLRRINRDPGLSGKGLAIAGVALSSVFMLVGFVGLLTAIAMPNMIRYQQRAKHAEPQTHLAAIQEQFEKVSASQPRNFEQLGYTPGPGRQYTYFFGTEILEPDQGLQLGWPEGVRYGQRAVAAANLDQDETVDVWLLTEEGQIEHFRDDSRE